MTIFLSESLPQPPAFLYAAYAPAATVTASSSVEGYLAEDVMQADENNGWKPSVLSSSLLTIDLGKTMVTDHFAIVGNAFAGVTVALLGSSTGASFTDVLVPESIMPAGGSFWKSYAPASFRYLQLFISGQSSQFQIKHFVAGILARLPYLEDGFCSNPMQAEGQHLISDAGLFLGSLTQRVLRPFSLDFGQITSVEEVAFSAWAEACIHTSRAFFFVPDTGQAECHFGYVDKKYKYEPTMKSGLITIPRIPFTARAI